MVDTLPHLDLSALFVMGKQLQEVKKELATWKVPAAAARQTPSLTQDRTHNLRLSIDYIIREIIAQLDVLALFAVNIAAVDLEHITSYLELNAAMLLKLRAH